MNHDKFYELLKGFWKFFWITLAENIFSQPFKRYQPSTMNGWVPKSTTTPRAVSWHFSTKIPILIWFFGKNHQVGTYSAQKNWYLEFSSFFATTSIWTGILANLRSIPAPHGAPLMTTHTTTYHHVFSIQQAQEWDFLAKSWPILQYFSFQGPTSILSIFWPFWPTLQRWPNSGGPWSGHRWCFPTYIHHAPCKKPRPAQGDEMRSFWDTPLAH